MKNKKTLIVSLVVLVVAFIGVFGYKVASNSKAVKGSKQIVVTVINENEDYTKEHTHGTDALNLGEAVEEMNIAQLEDGAYGSFLVGADDFIADEGKQQWWKVTVNGKDAETGLDGILLNDGDRFEFILMTGW